MILNDNDMVLIGAGFILVLALIAALMRKRSHKKLNAHQRDRIVTVARQALDSMDVPIGALLIYKNEIIGEGYNTVLRSSDAGGHAEINAISDSIKRMGMEQFAKLERKSLYLVTTFEPCLMCAGAFITYNIHRVYFMKGKDFRERSMERARFVRYYFTRRKLHDAGEQDALFEQHPRYPKRKISAEPVR